MRPSAEGPTELKLTRSPNASTAPMASAPKASAGAPSVPWSGWKPELPAELTKTTPRSKAALAAFVLMAVSPLRSLTP